METLMLLHGAPATVWTPNPEVLAALGFEKEGERLCWARPHPFHSGLTCRVWVMLPNRTVLTEHDRATAGIHRFNGHLPSQAQFNLLLQMVGWAAWK